MSAPAKKVLVVTYYFPPSGGVGVQRTLKFVKYLRDFGWEPVVLTARNADYPAYDETLFAQIPEGVRVYRSRILEPYRLYRRFTGRAPGESTDIATLTLAPEERRRLNERISEWVRATFFVPDARIAWRFFAVRLGLKVIRQEHIQAIFSSAPPYTTQLIARNLKRATGLPWVADFRDSWIGWLSTPQWRPALSRAVERRMERSVLAEADRVLTVSAGVKEDLLSRNPHLRDARWSLLPNGFDPEDFPRKKNNECVRDRLMLTYSGSLYGPRNPEYLIRALEAMQQDGTSALEHLRLRLVGRVGRPILARIDSSPVRDLFEFKPYMSHQASLALLQESDVLLLIIDDVPASRGILTGKLFEYIGAGKPILALAPDGEAADLIRAHGLGRVVHPKNVSEIRNALAELIDLKLNGKLQVKLDRAVREKFDRKALTRRLAEVLDGLVG